MTGKMYKDRVDKTENILKQKIMIVLDNTLKVGHGSDWGERVINKDKAVNGIMTILKEEKRMRDGDLDVCE
jgi:hypothetical protein